jgi:hypothetical protein
LVHEQGWLANRVQALVQSRASTGRAAGCVLNERAQRKILLCFAEPTALSKIRPDLATYLFFGSEDPVGQQLESVRALIDRDRTAGVRNVSHYFAKEGGTKCSANQTVKRFE